MNAQQNGKFSEYLVYYDKSCDGIEGIYWSYLVIC